VSADLRTDVVVVGAGPVGLAVACELRLGGAQVVVLERRTAPSHESRASTLHARTAQLLDSRGLLERLGAVQNDRRGHLAGIPLDLDLPGPYAGQWKVPQTRTEELLGAWASALDVDVFRGQEVRAVVSGANHVDVVANGVWVRADHVVACDGEDSSVRHFLGADFPGHDAGRQLLRADVAWLDIPNRRFERLPRGLAISARRPDGVTRVMLHEFDTVPAEGEPTFEDVAKAWERVTGEDISAGTPLWVNAFGDANRQLTSYRDGRVFFAGDAAHRQLPVGGQALNLGLQDAFNLGWKLAARVRGDTDLLDTYHAERHPVGARTLANIEAQATLLMGGPEVAPTRELVAELVGLPSVRTHLAGLISGADTRYDLGDGHPLLGAVLPHAPLTTLGPGQRHTTTTALLRSGRGVLLDLSGDARLWARRCAGIRGWAGRVDLATARLDAADERFPATLLVRPDGHVAWTGEAGADPSTALTRWFGEPRKP
jgi:bifunctional oxygenase/reductase